MIEHGASSALIGSHKNHMLVVVSLVSMSTV
jgi:hypothetical protein